LVPLKPNCTHVGSPLDVGIYSPLKRLLKEALKKRRELTYSSIASWIGPAIRAVFTPENIKSAFAATGIWDQQLDGPNITHVNSQFQHITLPLQSHSSKQTLRKDLK
jgi:hypothetical protein